MNNSAALTPNAPIASQRYSDAVPVSNRFRFLQVLSLLGIMAFVMYYNLVGAKSGGERPAVADQIGFLVLAAYVALLTPAATAIAAITWREALRRRWMTALLGVSVVILGAANFFTAVQPGEEQRFLRDFGVGFIILITLLMTIFLGVSLVPPDIERRTIFTILSKPVSRLEFILGKFSGLALTLGLNLLVLTVVFLLSYTFNKVSHETWEGALKVESQHPGLYFDLSNLVHALVLHYGQLVVLAALALTMSLVVSPITAIVFSFLIYFGGQMSSYWGQLGGHGAEQDGHDHGSVLPKPVQGVVSILYYTLPKLDRFDVRDKLVTDAAVTTAYVWKAFGGGLVYVAVLLTIGYLVFSDREF